MRSPFSDYSLIQRFPEEYFHFIWEAMANIGGVKLGEFYTFTKFVVVVAIVDFVLFCFVLNQEHDKILILYFLKSHNRPCLYMYTHQNFA